MLNWFVGQLALPANKRPCSAAPLPPVWTRGCSPDATLRWGENWIQGGVLIFMLCSAVHSFFFFCVVLLVLFFLRSDRFERRDVNWGPNVGIVRGVRSRAARDLRHSSSTGIAVVRPGLCCCSFCAHRDAFFFRFGVETYKEFL